MECGFWKVVMAENLSISNINLMVWSTSPLNVDLNLIAMDELLSCIAAKTLVNNATLLII